MSESNAPANGGAIALEAPAQPRLPAEETEFLPAWYPQLRRRRRALLAQAAAVAGLAICLSAWSISIGREVRDTEASLARAVAKAQADNDSVHAPAPASVTSVQARAWSPAARTDGSLPPARVIGAIGELVPPQMTL
ncbi:MAG TPA: hypothetical protein VFD32_10660, partial [Dehalococcoidia bacterium]|nr:hypothetical protein [Dehalococcoidia bacterium]